MAAVANPLALVRKYRTPLVIAGGGLAAYTAFQASRGRASASQAAAIAAAAPAGSAPGLTPEQVAALYGGAQQGALGLFQAGLAPTEAALGLAGSVVGIAGQVAGGSLDALAGLAGTLGSVAGTAVGVLPSFAPVEGIQPQPTQPAPAPAPTSPTPTQPAPTSPTPTPTRSFVGYEVVLAPGTYVIWTVDATGKLVNRRANTWTSTSRAQVARVVSGNQLHWRTIGGSYNGWSYVPGQSGAFAVRKHYLWSDGRHEYVSISQTGS